MPFNKGALMRRQTSNKSIAATAVPQTEEAMRAEELAFISELKAAALVWYRVTSPGIDGVALGFEQVVCAADKAATPYGDASESFIPARWDAVVAMRGALRLEKTLRTKKIQASRRKVLGPKDDGAAYELRTVELIFELLDERFKEGGLWNFVRQLLEAAETMHQNTQRLLKDETIERKKRLFVAAFSTRHHLGLVPPVILEALDFLGSEAFKNEGASALQSP